MALAMRKYLFRTVLACAWLLVPGLSVAVSQDNSAVAVAPQATLPAAVNAQQSVDWRNEIGVFKIGLVRGWSSDMSRLALARVESVFAEALGTPVKVVVFGRFTALMDAQADGRIDLAAYSARAFATIRLMCECVDAVATPTTHAGDTGQTAILAGDTLLISDLANIAGAKLGRLATATVSGKEMVRGALTVNKKPVTGNEPFWVDYPDYATAVSAYQNNEIAGLMIPVASSFGDTLEALSQKLNALNSGALRPSRPKSVLWRSSFWPYGPLAVRNNLAADAKAIILGLLEQMDITAPLVHGTLSEGLAGPFRKTNTAGFSNVSASIRSLVSQNANWR